MSYNEAMEGEFKSIGQVMKDHNIELIGADPATRFGFTQVPNFILTKHDISVGAKLAYAMLLKYAWDDDFSFPGQARLAVDMGSGERSVRRYLEELEDVELLQIVKRGLGRTNLYRLFVVLQKPGSVRRGHYRPANLAGLDRP